MIGKIERITVANLMKFWNNKRTDSTLDWDTCVHLEYGLKGKWDR